MHGYFKAVFDTESDLMVWWSPACIRVFGLSVLKCGRHEDEKPDTYPCNEIYATDIYVDSIFFPPTRSKKSLGVFRVVECLN